ncbi:hypothetical protein BGW38_000491, partial [Lunasporangiospora selenospora]
MITPNLPKYTARIVDQLERNLDEEMAKYELEKRKDGMILVENPTLVIQLMIASSMAHLFVGPEIAKNDQVLDSFITATDDLGRIAGRGEIKKKSIWRTFLDNTEHRLLSPLQKHVDVLVKASTPFVLERRRLEQQAMAAGHIYERSDDILQRLLDDFEKYKMVDLEDICGNLIMLVLSGVHTTADASANMLYYLAAFPECIDTLFEEQQEVLDTIQKEREQQRQVLIAKDEPIPENLNSSEDRALSATAIKRMIHMDSFVREIFRYRTEQLSLAHRARRNVTLSNGMVISKGVTAIINMKSVHQSHDQGEDVEKFRPWRFVGKSKTATKIGSDFLPFDMGKHACPGRFLAIQELKTIGLLMVSRYSKIEIQDPSKTQKILRIRTGASYGTGLLFTSRQ